MTPTTQEDKRIEERPFYEGQRVVAVDAHPESLFKNGKEYIIRTCHYSENPGTGRWYWYVGTMESHDWCRPGIFAPIEEGFKAITFTKVIEEEMASVN